MQVVPGLRLIRPLPLSRFRAFGNADAWGFDCAGDGAAEARPSWRIRRSCARTPGAGTAAA